MSFKNVLIVEDESIVALELSGYVESLGFKVAGIASSAKQAYEITQKHEIDLVLMDVHIKGEVDGISCAREIKKSKDVSLIYISAFSDDDTLRRAIQTDPSSYLIKPLNRMELKVAIGIAMKNSSDSFVRGDIILDGEFSFDSKNGELILQGENIHLTKQEKLLLCLLLASKNTILSIYEMENALWPDKQSNENTRRALVSRLRSKLKYKFLETIHSIGYRINI